MTAALFALGEERSEKLHTFVCNPQKESQDSEGQQDSFDGLSLEQGMAAARARVRSPCTCACCYCCRPCGLLLRKMTQIFFFHAAAAAAAALYQSLAPCCCAVKDLHILRENFHVQQLIQECP